MNVQAHTSPESLRALAAAAELATAGQLALRYSLRVGASERELLEEVREAMAAIVGEPVDAGVDLLSGARTALVDGEATERTIQSGDPVILDLAPQRDGYWADSCSTVCCGAPGPGLRKRHEIVLRALEAGMAAARPGAIAGSVDKAVRAVLEAGGLECPHHTGHAVGTEPQQEPFLVPGSSTPLEEGMAIAIEPGAYSGRLGVRLEHLTVIEADGARPLTEHSLALTVK